MMGAEVVPPGGQLFPGMGHSAGPALEPVSAFASSACEGSAGPDVACTGAHWRPTASTSITVVSPTKPIISASTATPYCRPLRCPQSVAGYAQR